MTENGSSSKPIFIPGSGIVLEVVSSILVIIRLYARFSGKGGKAGVDDVFLILGWLLGTVMTILAIVGSLSHDYSNHISKVPVEQQASASLFGYLNEIFFTLCLPCVKIAIFLFYHELTRRIGHFKLLWTVRATLMLLVVNMITFFVLLLAACKPIKAQWRRFDPTYDGTYACVDVSAAATVAGAVGCLTDFIAVAIPLVLVYLIDKPFKQKLGLYFPLSLGFMVLAAGLARPVLLNKFLVATNHDWTWLGSLLILASIWEYHLALICACAPFVHTIYKDTAPHLQSLSMWISFMNGRNVHATKKLDTKSSDRSLRTKSPILARRGSKDISGITLVNEKPVRKPLPVVIEPRKQRSHEDNAEITVAYQPSPSQSDIAGADLQSPTLPPENRWRLSGLSWITGSAHSRNSSDHSRWSGLRTPGTEILRITDQSGVNTPRSPTTPRSTQFPRSPGLSVMDVLDEIPDVPALPDMRELEPAMSSQYVACRTCGQYHPYGHQHRMQERESSRYGAVTPKFGIWRTSKTRRQSQSTFFMDGDDEDEEVAVV